MIVVLIEDEPLVAKDLVKLITRVDKEIQIAAVIGSVEAARKYFSTNPMPELIFADIQLADGVSFEIFKEGAISCPIIFTTAYDEYAIAAFKLNSIDYLLKPIDENELINAIAKFRKLTGTTDIQTINERLLEMFRQMGNKGDKKHKSRFTGHYGKSIVAVPAEQIAYFIREEIIFLVTTDQRQIVTDYHSLEEVEELLSPEKFIRANRQYIVNIEAIDNVKAHYTGKLNIALKLPLKAEINISREKSVEFKKWFEGN
jgi:two-component system LytT family response regulator